MKLLTFDAIQNMQVSPKTCYDWVNEVLLHKEETVLPAKISLKSGKEGVFFNTMPCILPSANVFGVKEVSRFPKRTPALSGDLLLYDLESGELLALMDADWITTMRTGAVAAHSIHLFAVPDFTTVAFMGLGNTARATLLVLLSLYPERELTIKVKRYKNQHREFQARFSTYPNLHFVECDSDEDLIRGSQVVVSAVTYTDGDFCSDDCFDEGVLLVPIHTRGFTNCDLFFDKVYADDTGHVCEFKNFSKFRSFAEVSDVLTGKKKGRENVKERILAYNIGVAIHDVYFAKKLYDLIGDEAQACPMHKPSDKFWI